MEAIEKKETEEDKKAIEMKEKNKAELVDVKVEAEVSADVNKDAPYLNPDPAAEFEAQMAELESRAKETPLEPLRPKAEVMKPSEILDWSLRWLSLAVSLAYITAHFFIYHSRDTQTAKDSTIILSIIVASLFGCRTLDFLLEFLRNNICPDSAKATIAISAFGILYSLGNFGVWISVQVYIFGYNIDCKESWPALWILLLLYTIYGYFEIIAAVAKQVVRIKTG